MVDGTDRALMVPMLPCGDIDEMADFWTALGLTVTYRQRRPKPYVALGRGGINLHYFKMDGVDPALSYSTCAIVVPDTAALHQLFVEGFRARFGRVPLTGHPRMTRPRARANNAGLSGFSVIDPAGNWAREPRPGPLRGAEGGRRPRRVGVVRGRSARPGDGERRRPGRLPRRHGPGPCGCSPAPSAVMPGRRWPSSRPALAYLTELRARVGDHDGARRTAEDLGALADRPGISAEDLTAVVRARQEAAEAMPRADIRDREI